MTTFKVKGGVKLSGEITPQGAKNEALQILCATLLTSEDVIVQNIPNIRDVNILIDLLRDLEVEVNQISKAVIQYSGYTNSRIEKKMTKELLKILKQNNVDHLNDIEVDVFNSPFQFLNRRNEIDEE